MEDNTLDQNLYTTAMKEALKVEFLESNEEIKLYAASLYNAMIWGVYLQRSTFIQRQAEACHMQAFFMLASLTLQYSGCHPHRYS